MGFDFIVIVPFLPHCGLFSVFGHGLSFFDRFQYPVDGSTASGDFSAFTGEDAHMSFYSAILNQKPQATYFKYLCIDRGVEDLGIQHITSSYTLSTHTTQSCAPFNNMDNKKVVWPREKHYWWSPHRFWCTFKMFSISYWYNRVHEVIFTYMNTSLRHFPISRKYLKYWEIFPKYPPFFFFSFLFFFFFLIFYVLEVF